MKPVNPEDAENIWRKGDRSFALEVKRTYDGVCKKLSGEARLGNNKSALELMKKMTEQNIVLRHLGFRITDSGRIASI